MSNSGCAIERIRPESAKFSTAKLAEFEIFGICNEFTVADDIAAREMLTYKPYERSSEFYLACLPGEASTVVGVVRMIRHNSVLGLDSFSTLKDARCYPTTTGDPICLLDPQWISFFERTDPRAIAELATQAILPAYRQRGAIEYLWIAIIDVCNTEGVEMWTIALTLPLFRWYQSLFPNALRAIGTVMPNYVGANSIPGVFYINHPEVKAYRAKVRQIDWSTRVRLRQVTKADRAIPVAVGAHAEGIPCR